MEQWLAKNVRKSVLETKRSVPITPAILDSTGRVEIDNMYIPQELFINRYDSDVARRYKLKSELEIFDNSISELSSRHVLIEGRSGSGKTVFLYKLAVDWAMKGEKKDILFGEKTLVFLFPVSVLIKAGNIGVAAIQHILPNNSPVCDTYINDYCSQHPSKVAILIDDCNGEEDIKSVMNMVKEQQLLECQVVMTTKNVQLAKEISRKHHLQHVTMSGLNPDDSVKNTSQIFNVLKNTSENKEQELPAFEKLSKYFGEHILEPQLMSHPHFLVTLCQLSIYTKGTAFDMKATLGSILISLLMCMFTEHKKESSGVRWDTFRANATETHHITSCLTQAQRRLLIELGKVAWLKSSECSSAFSKADFCENGEDSFDEGIEIGILQYDQEVDQVNFVLEIVQELCKGVYLAHLEESALSEQIIKINIKENIDKLANVFVFACSVSDHAQSVLIDHLAQIVSRGHTQARNVKDKLQLQKIVHVCFQVNYECKCEGALNSKLTSLLFEKEKLRFVGISSHIVRLLSYFVKYARTTLIVKSVELFRFGNQDWTEQKEYFVEFFPLALEDSQTFNSIAEKSVPDSECARELKEIDKRDKQSTDTSLTMEARGTDNQTSQSRDISMERAQISSLPKSPLEESDMIIQSSDLQELKESQYGKCLSSSAGHDFAQNLSWLMNVLENVILVGTILESQHMRDFVHHFDGHTSLKKLVLCLNENMDDSAFEKLMESLHVCSNLADLRLSLYRVTNTGFEHVQRKMEGAQQNFLRRVNTLFLLHSSSPESFAKFLLSIQQYMENVRCLHVSASEGLPDAYKHTFMQNLSKPEIMPNLEELSIDEEMVPKVKWLSLKQAPYLETSTSLDGSSDGT